MALALVATATLDAIPFSSLTFLCSAFGSDLASALDAILGAILGAIFDVIFGSILVAILVAGLGVILGSTFGSILEPAAFFGSLAFFGAADARADPGRTAAVFCLVAA